MTEDDNLKTYLNTLTDDELDHLVEITYIMSMLAGVYHCGSVEKTILCNQIFHDKHKKIPREQIELMYDRTILTLIGKAIQIDGVQAEIAPHLIRPVQNYIETLRESF